MLLTTTQRPPAIEVTQSDWDSGYPDQDSYVNPWVGMTMKAGATQNKQGELVTGVVEAATADLAQCAGVSGQ